MNRLDPSSFAPAKSRSLIVFATVALLLIVILPLSAADWPQFRGPNGNGAVDESAVPAQLSLSNALAWKVTLPGRGISSPIIVGDRVFVTCSSGLRQQRLHIICFNAADGSKRWERQFWATGRTMTHEKTSVAAPTPASDGRHIAAIFSSNDIVCLDLDGNLIWFRGLGRDYPNASNTLGMTSSLLIVAGVVIAQVESESEAFTVGLDLQTGTNQWKLERRRGANWTSPILLGTAPAETVALQSSKGVTAIDPANGKIAWSWTNGGASMPSSTLRGRTLFIPSQTLTALNISPDRPPVELWRSAQLRPGTSSPMILGDHIFVLNDAGVLNCGDATTGTRLWQLRLKGPFSSSPIGAGRFVYCINEKGLVQVIDASKPEGELVNEVDLAETVLSTPSIANGAIYFRSDGRLWKFGKS